MEYFTDFEEFPSESIEESIEKSIREIPWTLKDFTDEFARLGLIEESGKFVNRRTVETGRVIVNGIENIQTQELVVSFSFNLEFTAQLDGSYLAGIDVHISVGPQELLSELIYTTPEDFETFYKFYTEQKRM